MSVSSAAIKTRYILSKTWDKPATILGLMSGTSLDGLDMALCRFAYSKGRYSYKILGASTVSYSRDWKMRLKNVKDADAKAYFELDAAYAAFVAQKINLFLKRFKTKPQAIASHGHTIFHRPDRGFSTQMGNGAIIAAKTGISTVNDFRSLDLGFGGQGAPLVPIGDELLFKAYDACLNIGGIANISLRKKGRRVAWDICGANLLLNYLAQKLGQDFDRDGKIAGASTADIRILEELNALPYFSKKAPKSLGREWFEEEILPLFERSGLSNEILLATATRHVAFIIAETLNKQGLKNVLITGGGAFNKQLIKWMGTQTKCELIIPDKNLVMFKEALIFAFLAYLRLNNETNTLSSVTGAKIDSCGGAVYLSLK